MQIQVKGRMSDRPSAFVTQTTLTQSLKIRIDDANNLGCWLEVSIPLSELKTLFVNPCADLFAPTCDKVPDGGVTGRELNNIPREITLRCVKPSVEPVYQDEYWPVGRREVFLRNYAYDGETYEECIKRMASSKPCGEIPLGNIAYGELNHEPAIEESDRSS